MSLSDIVGGSGLHSWTELGLIVSFVTFLAVLIWLFVIRRGPSFEHESLLPLENDPVVVTNGKITANDVAAEPEEVEDK